MRNSLIFLAIHYGGGMLLPAASCSIFHLIHFDLKLTVPKYPFLKLLICCNYILCVSINSINTADLRSYLHHVTISWSTLLSEQVYTLLFSLSLTFTSTRDCTIKNCFCSSFHDWICTYFL